jgi:hypothetical protein
LFISVVIRVHYSVQLFLVVRSRESSDTVDK